MAQRISSTSSSGAGWYSPYSNPPRNVLDSIRAQLALIKPFADALPAPNPTLSYRNVLNAATARQFIPMGNALAGLLQQLTNQEGQITPAIFLPGERQLFFDQIDYIIKILKPWFFYYGDGRQDTEFLIKSLSLQEIRRLLWRNTRDPSDSSTLSSSSYPDDRSDSFSSGVSTPGGYSPYSGGGGAPTISSSDLFNSTQQYSSSFSDASGAASTYVPPTPGVYSPYSDTSSSSSYNTSSGTPSTTIDPGTPFLGYDSRGNPTWDATQVVYAKNAGM